jgi:hypothetical protein
MPDEPNQHITEALGGAFIPPLSHEEREEREDVHNLIQAVTIRYNSLVGRETDSERRAELLAKRDHYDEVARHEPSMTAAERQEVLRTYPEILAALRAQSGE